MSEETVTRRPLALTLWAILFGLGAVRDVYAAVVAYAYLDQDYSVLNPGLFAYFRPIAWTAAVLIPVGLWFRRWWAVALYVVLQTCGVILVYVEQPTWADDLPAWGDAVRCDRAGAIPADRASLLATFEQVISLR